MDLKVVYHHGSGEGCCLRLSASTDPVMGIEVTAIDCISHCPRFYFPSPKVPSMFAQLSLCLIQHHTKKKIKFCSGRHRTTQGAVAFQAQVGNLTVTQTKGTPLPRAWMARGGGKEIYRKEGKIKIIDPADITRARDSFFFLCLNTAVCLTAVLLLKVLMP